MKTIGRSIGLAIAAALALVAVPSASTRAQEPAVEMAPAPFTAEQIRDATNAGAAYEYHLEDEGRPVRTLKMEFVSVAAEGCKLRTTVLDASGTPEDEAIEGDRTWEELKDHGSFPKAATTITKGDLELPGIGKHPCVIYEVKDERMGKPATDTFWFATDMPGPPIKLVTKVEGKVTSTMTLVKHDAGKKK